MLADRFAGHSAARRYAARVTENPHRADNRRQRSNGALSWSRSAHTPPAPDQPAINPGKLLMRKCVLLLAVAIVAVAPSLASAKARRHAPPPPPPVDQNAAGAHFVSEGLRNFLIVPIQSVFAPAPEPAPVHRHSHHRHV
jgi:hypothetical protein